MMVTLALGLWGIRRKNSMWGDESVTYQLAHRSVAHIWRTVQHVDLVHALYYTLMHGLFKLFGGELLTLRLPSVVAMSLAAAGVGLVGHRLAGSRVGLLAGLVFPLIPQIQLYTQEGRSYAMVCALVTWSTYLLVRTVARPSRGRWCAYGLAMLLAGLLHEFAILAVAAHGVTLLVSGVPRPVMRAWTVAAWGAAAGLLPLAVFSAGQSGQVAWIAWPHPVQLLGLLAMAVVGVWCARSPVTGRGPISLAALALPILILPGLLLLLLLLAPIKPLFVDRYVLYSTIGFALLLGAGIDHAFRRPPTGWAPWAVAAAVLASLMPVSMHLRTPQSRHDDVIAIGRAVRQSAGPGDGLLYLSGRHRVWTQARPQDTRVLTDLALARDAVSSDTLSGTELPAQEIAHRMRAFRRIVAVRDAAGAHSDINAQELAKHRTLERYFRACTTKNVTGARVTVYARDDVPCPGQESGGTDQL
ncbi:glycosyltransferase family 39 protein [Streptomyces cyaneus]|uniref:glycosyltransferase family 39 protein n=1 Tax=Streptomyces cyaneus TaxID=1904 RepID=UPI0013E2D4D3|nr:glycosyltransferase family 39 protein [Streptomyces cyaneus]